MKVIEGIKGTREGRMQDCTHLATPFLQLHHAEPLCSICFIAIAKALRDMILSKFTLEEAETHQDVTYFLKENGWEELVLDFDVD